MIRRLVTSLGVVFLLLCLALVWLRFRAADTTDVFMLALPGGTGTLVTSHEGQWLELTALDGWPDRGVRWWSAKRPDPRYPGYPGAGGQTWQSAGPFKFWQNAPSSTWGPAWFVRGRLTVPADDTGRLPAYGDGYARADRDNAWVGVIPGQPGWLFMHGWELRIPHTWAIAATALPSSLILIPRIVHARRRRKRWTKGLCPQCGYDLRESPGRCPECGYTEPAAAPAQAV